MSIQSEIDRIRGNVQDTISAIQQTGVTVPEGANSDNLPSLAAALANEKQDRLTGTSGQFVGFDSGGNATAVAAPTAASIGALPTSGGTMTGSIKMGEHDITGTATNYGLFFDSMGQVIIKAGDSNSVEVTDMGVTIRSDVGITLNGSVSGITPASIGAVPTSRTVNGKALSADVTLSAADVGADAAGAASGVQTNLTSHTNNKSNPHSVTKAQVGLGNVDNTSDANKPISTATQTALNGKQATVTGGASTITSSNLTASRALVSNGSGKVAVSAVTSTELGYLDGVTSNIQTQINNLKASAGPKKLLEVTTSSAASLVELDLSSIDLSPYNALKVLMHYIATEDVTNYIYFNDYSSEKPYQYIHSGYSGSRSSFDLFSFKEGYFTYYTFSIYRSSSDNCVAASANGWAATESFSTLASSVDSYYGIWRGGTFDDIKKICFSAHFPDSTTASTKYQPGFKLSVYGLIA